MRQNQQETKDGRVQSVERMTLMVVVVMSNKSDRVEQLENEKLQVAGRESCGWIAKQHTGTLPRTHAASILAAQHVGIEELCKSA